MMQKAIGDGARASKFDVMLRFTGNAGYDLDTIGIMVKTTKLPSKTHQKLDFKFKGRSIPLKGQTNYDQTWECQFYLTQDHAIKNAFELWVEALDQKHNYHNPNDYKGLPTLQGNHYTNGYVVPEMHIYQKDFDNTAKTAKYIMYNVYPTEISTVQYDAEGRGQISLFTVTFSYSHYKSEVMKSKDGNFIDNLVNRINNETKEFIDEKMQSLSNAINGFIGEDALTSLENYGKSTEDFLFSDGAKPATPKTVSQLTRGGLGAAHMPSKIGE